MRPNDAARLESIYELVTQGLIEIDQEGRLWRSVRRSNSGDGRRIPCSRHRAEQPHKSGYLSVRVRIDGRTLSTYSHRLVWRHFKGPIPAGLTINHKDESGDKTDNRPGNLELATYSEQLLHARHVLGRKYAHAKQGEAHHNAKLTGEQVDEIRRRRTCGEFNQVIAASYGISEATVRDICKRRRWSHR